MNLITANAFIYYICNNGSHFFRCFIHIILQPYFHHFNTTTNNKSTSILQNIFIHMTYFHPICPWVSKRRNMAWYALAKGGAAYYPKLINQLFKDGETNTGYKKVGTIRLHHNLEKLKELEKIALQRQQESP